MADIQNLEILVAVDISQALASLEDLQDKLREVGRAISNLDKRGTEGISVRTSVDDLDSELAMLQGEIEAFERMNDITIGTNVRGSAASLGSGGGGDGLLPKTLPGRMQMMEASRAGNISELFDFLGRDPDSVVQDRGVDFAWVRNLRRGVDRVRESFSEFNIRMSDIHNLLATLLPLLAVFVMTIPAAVSALVGLAAAALSAAAAMGAILGLGAMGAAMGDSGEMPAAEDFTEFWTDIRDSFFEAFAPLAERLAPLFRDALDGLEMFFQEIANQGDALMELTDETRAFGQFLMDWFPGVLRSMAGTVEALQPIFSALGEYLQDTQILRKFVELTLEAAPALASLLMRLLTFLEVLAEMSVGFAMVSDAVSWFLGRLWGLFHVLGFTNTQLGVVLGSVLALTTGVALLSSTIIGRLVTSMAMAVYGLYQWFRGLLLVSSTSAYLNRTVLVGLIGKIYSFISALWAGQTSLMAYAKALLTAASAKAALLTLATLGGAAVLIAGALSAADAFLGLSDSIDNATSSLKEYDRVANQAGSSGFNPYAEAPRSGAGQEGAQTVAAGGGGGTTINIESSGDTDRDKSNTRYASWRQGRTTGGTR